MQPITSRIAHDKAKTTKQAHGDIIYNTLLKLSNNMGTASDICLKCKLDYTEVNRRVSELIADGRVYIVSERGGRVANTHNPCRIYKAVTGQNEVGSMEKEQGVLF